MIAILEFTLPILAQIGALWGGLRAARRRAEIDQELSIDTALARWPVFTVFVVLLGVFTALGIVVASFDRVAEDLPLWFGRFARSIWWGAAMGLFFAVGGVAWRLAVVRDHPKARALRRAMWLFFGTFLALHARLHLPAMPFLTDARDENGFFLQSSGSSCVAASLANVCEALGERLTEREAAEILGTTLYGTTIAELRYAADRLGFATRTRRAPPGDLGEIEPPAILMIDHPAAGRESHAVAYLSRDHDVFRVLDPLRGPQDWTLESSRHVWHGLAVEIRRP